MNSSRNDFHKRGLSYVNSFSDVRTALTNLVRSAIESAGSTSGSLYLLDKPRGVLLPFILVNFQDDYLQGCSEVPLGTQCCGRAALHKSPWVVADMWTDPLFVNCREAAMMSGMRSGFSVPVLTENEECLGTLGFQFRQQQSPSELTLELATSFAQLISSALVKEMSKANLTSALELAGLGRKPISVSSRTEASLFNPAGRESAWL